MVRQLNQLAHMRQFTDPSFTIVVRPNADTLYSVLTYDVTKEPLVISVPDSGGRYFLLQWLDMWSDVFTVPGTRTTGNAAQTFAIVGPKWQDTLPEGIREYRSPTGQGLPHSIRAERGATSAHGGHARGAQADQDRAHQGWLSQQRLADQHDGDWHVRHRFPASRGHRLWRLRGEYH